MLKLKITNTACIENKIVYLIQTNEDDMTDDDFLGLSMSNQNCDNGQNLESSNSQVNATIVTSWFFSIHEDKVVWVCTQPVA